MVWVRTIEGTTLAIFADPRYPEEHFAVWDFGPISAVPCNAYARGSRARVSGAIVHSRFGGGRFARARGCALGIATPVLTGLVLCADREHAAAGFVC